jgi:hypothetical protein
VHWRKQGDALIDRSGGGVGNVEVSAEGGDGDEAFCFKVLGLTQ